MALHLVTGYAGTEHITSANDAAMNIHSVGDGKFVVKGRGKEFTYNLNSNNEIAIFDGDAYIDGRYFTMIPSTSEKLAITNGSQNMFRNDLVVARYTMNNDDGIERMELFIIEGDESSSEAEDPAYYNGSIEDGDNPVDFPLYRIRLNGLNVVAVEQMFEKKAVGSGIIGDTDISDIGDGTVTGGIKQLSSNLAGKLLQKIEGESGYFEERRVGNLCLLSFINYQPSFTSIQPWASVEDEHKLVSTPISEFTNSVMLQGSTGLFGQVAVNTESKIYFRNGSANVVAIAPINGQIMFMCS